MSNTPKETKVLLLTLVITLTLLGIGFFFFQRSGGIQSITGGNNSSENGDNSADNSPNQTVIEYPETFAQVKNVPKGLFSHGGSTTWAPIRAEIDPAIQIVWPQFQLRYTDPVREAPSTGTGISMLLNNELAFALSSRPISKNEYETAEKRGFKIKEIAVGIDGIAVAVHPSLEIPGLTIQQHDDIYAGKITNWSEVGGPDLKIQPYGKIGRDDPNYAILTETTTEAIRMVARDMGGIYWSSSTLLVPQCTVKTVPIGKNPGEFVAPYQEPFIPLSQCPNRRNEVNVNVFRSGAYPWSRRLFVVVKENGQLDQIAGETYAQFMLTDQGQEIIRNAGFVSLR
ncbi:MULTISPECIES: PstS family phosphate ABC transporter substrate-binding protein [Planktothricoides]|uniref:Substrate-binding domain-containing protein n=2 Tax=Planktothricoides raciborskii TaxID=132608 RepID=A0AAU8JD51_9CYAN|nr:MULTISPECIES: substrate-binding domain-containing protein [Planktothricoides]KOR35697.1 phosphate ABC transporter substrate-binding protein [Planktothricoides sp. SR001]MBD2545811.1 substrate-binding domain-containing protein [Planktothricoides raciborskii FACHB-1370]MBD2583968.1 substrate-binding domain-containing protein [Planktothricoides raciborskii FACHB-1261]